MHIGILVMLACHGCEPLLLITIEGDRCDDGPCAMFVSEFLQAIFSRVAAAGTFGDVGLRISG